MRKIALCVLGGALVLWSPGVSAQMLDVKPVAKGGNPVGEWEADSTALRVYVDPELLEVISSLQFGGSASGQLNLEAEGTFQANYAVTASVNASLGFFGTIDTSFVTTTQTEGTYQVTDPILVLTRDTTPVVLDTMRFSVDADTLRLIMNVPLGTYSELVAALSPNAGPPVAVVNMLKVGGPEVPSGGVTGGLTADFDGSGTVDFADFVEFALNFGKRSEQAGFDSKFDLNGNGAVDFSDFVDFAQQFGKSA